jgi:hypothetical protein
MLEWLLTPQLGQSQVHQTHQQTEYPQLLWEAAETGKASTRFLGTLRPPKQHAKEIAQSQKPWFAPIEGQSCQIVA